MTRVIWTATCGDRFVFVAAPTWFAARARAAVRLGCGPEELVVEVLA